VDFTNREYLNYLEIASEFSKKYPFLDTAIFTLFQNVEDGISLKKKNLYKIKYYLFLPFILYKYYSLNFFLIKKKIPFYKNVSIAFVINSPGPQHFGDSLKLVENLTQKKEKVLIIYGSISGVQKQLLKNIENVFTLDQDKEAYIINIIEFIKYIFDSFFFVKKIIKIVRCNDLLFKIFNNNKGFLLEQFFVGLCHFNFSKKIIKKNLLKIIFSTNDGNYLARGYFVNAKEFGIENIITQHGFSNYMQTKTIANKVILWTLSDINYYLENNFPEEKILPLGLPRFDDIKDEKIKEEYDLKKYYGLDSNTKCICFAFPLHALNYNFKYYQSYIDSINSITSDLIGKNVQVFIRAHPNDNILDYRSYIKKDLISKIIIPSNSFPLIQLIKQMNVYIADFSTSIIEAMICNIPTILINFDNYWHRNFDTLNFNMIGGCDIVVDQKELLIKINKILYDNDYLKNILLRQNKFIDKNIINIGSATKRISDYFFEIMEKENK